MHEPAAEAGGAPTLADRLGELAADIRWPEAPEPVRRRVLALVADVLATAVAARDRPDVAALRRALAVGDGPSSVIGRLAGLPPSLAGLLNALPIAREQLQDGHRRARGHPGAHVVPAVLAVAEAEGAEGAATLSAILAGYEVGVRVGLAMDGTPPGVHDIATWATVGAAAGVAHLLGRADPAVIAAAIESAAALPVAPDAATVFTGFTAQNLYLGTAVQAAVLHGQAAAAGSRAAPGTLERHLAGRTAADPAGFAPRLGGLLSSDAAPPRRWTVLEGYLKRHPTCALLHGVNDAVEDLGPVQADRVREGRVRTYAAAAAFDQPAPHNDLAARFSIPWTVAAALHLGTLDETAFSDAALADPAMRDLAARIRVEHDPALDAGYPAGRPATVLLTLDDGSVLESSTVSAPRGDGPEGSHDPVVAAKPGTLLLRSGLGAEEASALLAAVAALEDRGVAPLGRVLRHLDSVGQSESGAAQFR